MLGSSYKNSKLYALAKLAVLLPAFTGRGNDLCASVAVDAVDRDPAAAAGLRILIAAVVGVLDLHPAVLNGVDVHLVALVDAGTKVVTLCKFALENSLSGLEFAYGIPGTCGGAVFMNAGAYGGEVKDVISEITYLTPDLELKTMPVEEAKLSYRHSVFKENDCIVVSAKFKMKKAPKEEIKTAMNDFLSRRKDKQPLEYPSAGSTFKRPEGYFAGALIEQCGFKGKSLGGAQISDKHAGFLINKDKATAKDILDLIKLTQETVKKETGVTLEPEVIILR